MKNNQLTQEDIRFYTRLLWKTAIGIFIFCASVLLSVALGTFGPLPSLRDLENPKSNLASEVLADDETVLGTFFVQNRSKVRFQEISHNVINALIVTEDKRFYEHSGIDFRRVCTIIFYNLIGKKQGASTITQQLALNLFSKQKRAKHPLKRVIQKLQEWIMAVQIERNYTKEEIITMYLNTVDFGAYNTFGIKSAAHTYFGITPDQLNLEQAALLVGMINGPGIYSPVRNPKNALRRRNFIFHRMEQEGLLNAKLVAVLKKKPLRLNFKPVKHTSGLATYFRSIVRKAVQRIFETQLIRQADGTPYDLDRDGLKIYTSINARMQRYAEEAQREYLQYLQEEFNNHWKSANLESSIHNFKQLIDNGLHSSDRCKQLKLEGKSPKAILKDFNTPTKVTLFTWAGSRDSIMKPIDSVIYSKMILRNAIMSMDPNTGHVKAWVGGINFEHFQYDQVKMGTRQVGSTAKPFTYAVAIDNGFSPCMTVPNEPITINGYGAPWSPRSTGTVAGTLTLYKAMAHSQNWITAYVMQEVGPNPVVNLIKKMGVKSPDLRPYPSICLGTFNASVFDMTAAYSVFVNHGIWTEPTYILRIEDKNGNVLYEKKKPRIVVALNEQTAYAMVHLLQGVVREGTGRRIYYKYGLTNPIGGKTGTTQDNSDGWFIGITPQLVTGIWTGCEDRDIHFRSTYLGGGANTCLPIFALYMKKLYADPSLDIQQAIDFTPPQNFNITLDCDADQNQQPDSEIIDKALGF